MMTPSEYTFLGHKLTEAQHSERKIGEAYLALRTLIPGALDTPHGPSLDEIRKTTETALKNLIGRVEIRDVADYQARQPFYDMLANAIQKLTIGADARAIVSMIENIADILAADCKHFDRARFIDRATDLG